MTPFLCVDWFVLKLYQPVKRALAGRLRAVSEILFMRSLTVLQHAMMLSNRKKFHRTALTRVKNRLKGCFHRLPALHAATPLGLEGRWGEAIPG